MHAAICVFHNVIQHQSVLEFIVFHSKICIKNMVLKNPDTF